MLDSMTKTIMILIIAAALVAGTISTATFVSAAPPENNPGKPFDAILQKLDVIIATLTGTDTEVTNIQEKLDDPNTGLAAIKTAVDGISTGGIPASTQTQIDNIESDVGMIKTTVGDIDAEVTNIEGKLDGNVQSFVSDIKTETDKIQMVKDNQYVPFTKTQTPLGTCASAGASNVVETFRIAKTGESGDFIITGIIMKVGGVNPGAKLSSIQFVFGGIGYPFSTVDLISGFSGNPAVELLGAPTNPGRTTPYQIALDSSITIHLLCTATASADLDLTHVVVSGWKKPGHTISIFIT